MAHKSWPVGCVQRFMPTAELHLVRFSQFFPQFLKFILLRPGKTVEITNLLNSPAQDIIPQPVALDMPAMMALTGEMRLSQQLAALQTQIFQIIRQEHCVPANTVDLELFDEILSAYRDLVLRHSEAAPH